MARYQSRAARLSDALAEVDKVIGELQQVIDDAPSEGEHPAEAQKAIAKAIIEKAQGFLPAPADDIRLLAEEMGSWRDNMSGTNLENT